MAFQRIAVDVGLDRIGALSGVFEDHVSERSQHVGVVAESPQGDVVPGAAVQQIIAAFPVQGVVAVRSVQVVSVGAADQGVIARGARGCITRAPNRAISSISPYVTSSNLKASLATRGSVE